MNELKNDLLLHIEGATKSYKTRKRKIEVLKNINLDIYKGEFVAIEGESGSGKSTLLQILGLLDTPDVGNYFINGVNTTQLGDKSISRMRNQKFGFVFQDFQLFSDLNVLDNVKAPLNFQKISESKRSKQAKDLLSLVEMVNFTDRYPHELSGGQKQRVAVARALIMNPEIILADEPTGSLDARNSENILNLFKKINSWGKTIILITHEATIANQCKRRLVMCDGALSERDGKK